MSAISRAAAAVVLLVACALVPIGAQRGAPPPVRDTARPAQPPAGTAFIGGTVFEDAAAGAPLRRATVTLRNIDLTNAAMAVATSRVSVTDDAGKFGFANLAAGRFILSVAKPAYLTTAYGAKALRGQGLAIAITEGQSIPDLIVKMPRGAVITGRLVDETGRPAVGVRVGVAEQVVINGERTYRSSFGLGAETDDRGVYRIFGLAPATYLVGTGSGLGSSLGGGPRVTTAAEVEWARRGNPTMAGRAQPPPARGPGIKPASVFYPGTTNSTSAAPITVTAGEERSGIDFTVHVEPTASLQGTVTRADGRPGRNVQVLPILVSNSVQVGFPPFPPRATITPQGQFSVSGLAPGHYLVSARASSGEVMGPAPGGRGAGAPIADLWATAEIDVAGEDMTGLVLTLMPGMSVSGRLAFESTATSPPADLTTTRLTMNAPPGATVSLGVPAIQAAADGSFSFPSVAPGAYLVSAFMPSGPASAPTWVLKSAVVDGRDVLDTPLDVRPGSDTSGVVVTFTDQVTQLTGTLTDPTGRPAPSYFVIAYTTNAAQWRQQSRWLRAPTRPASDGRFTIPGLPPGEYYLAALSEFNQQEWFTPEFLQQLVPMSLKFTLAEGEKKVQDLKLAGQ